MEGEGATAVWSTEGVVNNLITHNCTTFKNLVSTGGGGVGGQGGQST